LPYASATAILLNLCEDGFPKILKSVFGIFVASSKPEKTGKLSLSFSAKITAEAPFLNKGILNT